MQPNPSRPVMDVARRPSMPTQRSSVRPAPAISKPPETVRPLEPKMASVPKAEQKADRVEAKKTTPAIAPKSTMPVGIIVMSLLVMMVLIGLAVVIYLTS